MNAEPIVFIVDDDPDFLELLSLRVRAMGLPTKTFPAPDDFLAQFDPGAAGCLVLDLRMPKINGLAVQERLAALPICPPIIIMTGHAEVPTALQAMRQGAVDLLQKTSSDAELYDALQRALKLDAEHRVKYARQQAVAALFAQLSPAEKQVLGLVLRGEANKRTASALGVSRRTVEDRRARLMQKLGVDTLADLVRLASEAGLHPEDE